MALDPVANLGELGSQLTCPICLGLMKKASNLTCNHNFCKSCITTSMKRASVCPVCKVPTTKREVRPAPNLDSMVQVYRRMEVASGVQIFCSQPPQDELGPGMMHDEPLQHASPAPAAPKSSMKRSAVESAQIEPATNGKRGKGNEDGIRTPAIQDSRGTPVANDEGELVHAKEQLLGEVERPSQWSKPTDVSRRRAASLSQGTPSSQVQASNSRSEKRQEVLEEWSAGSLSPAPLGGSIAPKKRIQLMPPPGFGPPLPKDVYSLKSSLSLDIGKLSPPRACHVSPSKSMLEASACNRLFQKQAPATLAPKEGTDLPPVHVMQALEPSSVQSNLPLKAGTWSLKACKESRAKLVSCAKVSASSEAVTDAACSVPVSSSMRASTLPMLQKKSGPLSDRQNGVQKVIRSVIPTFFWLREADNEEKSTQVPPTQGTQVEPTPTPAFSDLQDSAEPRSEQIAQVPVVADSEPEVTPVADAECSKESTFCLSSPGLPKLSPAPKADSDDSLDSPVFRVKRRPQKVAAPAPSFPTLRDGSLAVELSKKDLNGEIEGPKLTQKDKIMRGVLSQLELRQQHFDLDKVLIGEQEQEVCKSESYSRIAKRRDSQADISSYELAKKSRELFKEARSAQPAERTVGRERVGPAKRQESSPKRTLKPEDAEVQQKLSEAEEGGRGVGPACCFCRQTGNSKVCGPMLEINLAKGRVFRGDEPAGRSRVNHVHTHEFCLDWVPEVYWKGEKVCNVKQGLARSHRLSCASCGLKGAALGCWISKCRKSFHFACAKALPTCRWSEENFVMLCPEHGPHGFPAEILNEEEEEAEEAEEEEEELVAQNDSSEDQMTNESSEITPGDRRWPPGPASKWVLCASGLNQTGREQLAELAALAGACVVKDWSSEVTHLVTGLDQRGRAKRTLKFLSALLQGQWVVTPQWLETCISSRGPAGELPYLVEQDVHSVRGGARRSRHALVSKKEAPLFVGIHAYFHGEFQAPSKQDLAAVLMAGGGAVLQRRPLLPTPPRVDASGHQAPPKRMMVFYQRPCSAQSEPQCKELARAREDEAESIALPSGATALPHTWLLDSAAGYALLPF